MREKQRETVRGKEEEKGARSLQGRGPRLETSTNTSLISKFLTAL